jgi:hypothetical protein
MPPPTRSDTVRSPFVGGRETVESIVVAFALALLFRAFEAEAFVIPTGSMAPTLMGRHKDLACPACGATFQVGASQEWDEAAGRLRPDRLVPAATCFNCGHETPLAAQPGQAPGRDARPLDGDIAARVVSTRRLDGVLWLQVDTRGADVCEARPPVRAISFCLSGLIAASIRAAKGARGRLASESCQRDQVSCTGLPVARARAAASPAMRASSRASKLPPAWSG